MSTREQKPEYDCPHCGAYDSTRCEKLVPVDVKPYSRQDFQAARDVGCRVAHYVDLRARDELAVSETASPR
jgi:hypothetical protein